MKVILGCKQYRYKVDNDMLEHGPGVLARAMSAVAMA
jgi:hypothetical protein